MLIWIALSTILTILLYYGIIRYLKLCCVGCDYFVKSYVNLDKPEERTVISMEAKPDMVPVINSILDSTVRVDEIAVYKYNGQEINSCVSDYVNVYSVPSSQKLINLTQILLKETNANTNIILLGTERIYGVDLIETLLEKQKENKNSLIYVGDKLDVNQGILLKPRFLSANVIKNIPNNVSVEDWIDKNLLVEKVPLNYTENYKCKFL